MRGWMKDERQMICCCSDGTRPVIFKIDRLDYQRVSIKGMGCENCEKKVKNNMRFEKGVKELSTELKNKTVSITYDAEKTDVMKQAWLKYSSKQAFLKRQKACMKKALSGIEGYEVTGVEE